MIFLTKAEHRRLHFKDKPKSVEHRTKLSEANARPVYQIHKTTGIIIREWKFIKDAEKVLGIAHSNIVKCCKGKLKSTGGFIWRYVN